MDQTEARSPFAAMVEADAMKLRWGGAIVAWDLCDPAPLAALVERETVPIELRPVLAAIIAGVRKPNRRAAANSKVPAAERVQIGATIAAVLDTIREMREKGSGIVDAAADAHGVDPVQIVQRLNWFTNQTYARAAERLSVSCETVENIVREYRRVTQNWPDV